jgi:hypothetical protein
MSVPTVSWGHYIKRGGQGRGAVSLRRLGGPAVLFFRAYLGTVPARKVSLPAVLDLWWLRFRQVSYRFQIAAFRRRYRTASGFRRRSLNLGCPLVLDVFHVALKEISQLLHGGAERNPEAEFG